MSYSSVGLAWSVDSFREYLKGVPRPAWVRSVTLHHTASPSLAMRPDGLTDQHIINLRNYYKNSLGWSAGPHLFIDDHRIMGLSPINERGVHAVSFNSSAVGIEVLGDYDSEDPLSGRGLSAWTRAAAATLALLEWIGVEPTSKTVLFHRDDPRTSKTCPGRKVSKDWVLELIRNSAASVDSPTVVVPTEQEVKVVEYVSQKCGVGVGDVAKLLRKGDDGLFYLGEHWLERARYDAPAQATLAPKSEADEAIATINKWPLPTDEIIPVVAYAASALGIPYVEAAKRLVFKAGEFRWSGEVIGGASFDKQRQATVAPRREMDRILKP